MSSRHATQTFLSVRARGETEKALRVVIDGTAMWIPKSVIDSTSAVKREDDVGTLVIKKWYAKRYGLGKAKPPTPAPTEPR